MTKFTWGLTVGMWFIMAINTYAHKDDYLILNKEQYDEQLRALETGLEAQSDLKSFRDFHDSLLVLCDRKTSDSMCPPKPSNKPTTEVSNGH